MGTSKKVMKTTTIEEFLESKKHIIDKIYKNTQDWANANGYEERRKTPVDAFSAAISAADLDDRLADILRTMIAKLSEQEKDYDKLKGMITRQAEPVKYKEGIMVVPIRNTNGHNYPLGEPVLVTKVVPPQAVQASSPNSFGNTLPNDKASIIPANRKEIEKFLIKYCDPAGLILDDGMGFLT